MSGKKKYSQADKIFTENKISASNPPQHYGKHVQFRYYGTTPCVKIYFCDTHFLPADFIFLMFSWLFIISITSWIAMVYFYLKCKPYPFSCSLKNIILYSSNFNGTITFKQALQKKFWRTVPPYFAVHSKLFFPLKLLYIDICKFLWVFFFFLNEVMVWQVLFFFAVPYSLVSYTDIN